VRTFTTDELIAELQKIPVRFPPITNISLEMDHEQLAAALNRWYDESSKIRHAEYQSGMTCGIKQRLFAID